MIKKTKHPKTRGERLDIKKKKDLHDNASPVFKLLKEREVLIREITPQQGKENE